MRTQRWRDRPARPSSLAQAPGRHWVERPPCPDAGANVCASVVGAAASRGPSMLAEHRDNTLERPRRN
ncbi:hypothetical protein BDV96DRAFT_562642 [Lophiotrema nucula]|uniref:Uncharacterized protein n=1 Tax=Lophiotrema nucula TaxID=690887 RepID=A0A6A5ZUA4_9PLEO|nr:hypothetical protein BDV96DRAFT_562642 [Lophiotrema nucula]